MKIKQLQRFFVAAALVGKLLFSEEFVVKF